jgi:trehalose 6-phosphate synthase/phosphatase
MAEEPPPPPLVESPRPIEGFQRQESIHPGLHPSVTNVPVTPGIRLATYASDSSAAASQSYFTHDINTINHQTAQSPTEAAAGARSGHDILRKMSLTGHQRQASLSDTDPRAAFPSLSLSGSVISATFCIPHSLQYRKGRDWVSFFQCEGKNLH